MRRPLLLASALAIPLALLAPTLAFAQAREPALRSPSRAFGGIALLIAQPRGDFDRYVNPSFGLGGELLWKLDRRGILGLRVGGGYITYGRERVREPAFGGRIAVDVTTNNNILLAGVGPQLGLPTGRIRPYITGTAGLGYFFTQSSVRGTNDSQQFASTKNFSDFTFSWSAGGGLYIPLRGGARPISLELAARYHWNGETSYLRKGSIEENPDGQTVTITPIRSRADFITYRLGVSLGI